MTRSVCLLAGCVAVLTACGSDPDKDTATATNPGGGSGGTTDTPGTDGPLVHESGFTLTTNDAQSRVDRTATATYAVEVSEESVSGFISYVETDESGAETCSSVFNLRTVLPEEGESEAGSPCGDCDYGHQVQTDATSTTGTCHFPSALAALDQSPLFDHSTASMVFALYDDGTRLEVQLQTAEDGTTTVPLLDAGTAAFSDGVLSGTNTETAEVTKFWDGACQDPGYFTEYFTMIPGELALSDTLACGPGQDVLTTVFDTWERDLDHGETLAVSTRSNDQSVFLYVVAPGECLTPIFDLPQSCGGTGSAFCHSIELLAQAGGPYKVVVEGPCTEDGVVYEFDARVF